MVKNESTLSEWTKMELSNEPAIVPRISSNSMKFWSSVGLNCKSLLKKSLSFCLLTMLNDCV